MKHDLTSKDAMMLSSDDYKKELSLLTIELEAAQEMIREQDIDIEGLRNANQAQSEDLNQAKRRLEALEMELHRATQNVESGPVSLPSVSCLMTHTNGQTRPQEALALAMGFGLQDCLTPPPPGIDALRHVARVEESGVSPSPSKVTETNNPMFSMTPTQESEAEGETSSEEDEDSLLMQALYSPDPTKYCSRRMRQNIELNQEVQYRSRLEAFAGKALRKSTCNQVIRCEHNKHLAQERKKILPGSPEAKARLWRRQRRTAKDDVDEEVKNHRSREFSCKNKEGREDTRKGIVETPSLKEVVHMMVESKIPKVTVAGKASSKAGAKNMKRLSFGSSQMINNQRPKSASSGDIISNVSTSHSQTLQATSVAQVA